VSVNRSSDSSLVTLKVPSGNFIRFEIDTGAPCNVLPIHIYKKATGDCDLKRVTPAKSSIVSYDGGNVPVLGTVKLQVWKGSFTCLLLCRLVESKRCRTLRKRLMSLAYISHIDLEEGGAFADMFWPGMSATMKDFVCQCDVCLTLRNSQVQEPLLQHEVPARSWAKVVADICFHLGRTLLVVVDYFSDFIEADSLSSETSKSVASSLMDTFSRFEVPDSLVMDNGPCFASFEFAKTVDLWNFQHITSSPRYPQTYGKAENVVRTHRNLQVQAGTFVHEVSSRWCQ